MKKYKNIILKISALLTGMLGLIIGYFEYGIELPLVIILVLFTHNISKHETKN